MFYQYPVDAEKHAVHYTKTVLAYVGEPDKLENLDILLEAREMQENAKLFTPAETPLVRLFQKFLDCTDRTAYTTIHETAHLYVNQAYFDTFTFSVAEANNL